MYAKLLYARPAPLSHIAGVDDGDLGMLCATSPICHLVDPLLEGLSDPDVMRRLVRGLNRLR